MGSVGSNTTVNSNMTRIVERGSTYYLEYANSDVVIKDFASEKSALAYANKNGYQLEQNTNNESVITNISGMRKTNDTSWYGSFRYGQNTSADIIVRKQNNLYKVTGSLPNK